MLRPTIKMRAPTLITFLFILGVIGLSFCNTIDMTVDDLIADDLEISETPNGGAVLNYKWGVDRITWSYEPSVEYPEFMPDIADALDLWQNHTTEILFDYAGESNNMANLYFINVLNETGIASAKRNNECGFLNKDSEIKAFSCLGQDFPGRALGSEDQIKVFVASEIMGRSLMLVLAHETGHALGLAHTVTCEFDIKPIMYSGSNPCNSSITDYEIHATDIEALHVHYSN